MYLGQEKWQQKTVGFAGAQQQASIQHKPLQQQTEIGDATQITISGCVHGVVGPILCGNYVLTSLNHGKPAYQKNHQEGKPDVMLYYWDERDGIASSGWWLSPKVGSEVVWGFHPDRSSQTPPRTGWKVPYDGGVDPNFVITAVRRGGGPAFSSPRPPTAVPGVTTLGTLTSGKLGPGPKLNGPVVNLEEQKRRLEEARKAQEEGAKKRAEEAAKRQEEQQKRMEAIKKQQETIREERRAAGVIRAVLQKLKVVKPEDFEACETELQAALDKELENCGSQRTAVEEESSKVREQVKQRLALLQEQRKKLEERRAEEERRRQEAQAVANRLLEELAGLVDAAEAAAEACKQQAAVFGEEGDEAFTSLEVLDKAARSLEEAEAEAQGKAKACTDFIASKRGEMAASIKGSQAGTIAPKAKATQDKTEAEEGESESKPTLGSLQQRITSCKNELIKASVAAAAGREKKARKLGAQAVIDAGQALFKKYDQDRDGVLSKPEVRKYAKGVCDFELPTESLDLIFDVLVRDGAKGVSSKDIQRLKVMVGVAREKQRDLKRLEDRLSKEKELAEAKSQIEATVKEILETITSIGESLKEAEELTKSLPQLGAETKAQAALDLSSRAADLLKRVKESRGSAQERITKLETTKSEHAQYLRNEVKRLQRLTGGLEGRISRVDTWLKRTRVEAKKRSAQELELLRRRALKSLRIYQREKKMDLEALFAEADANSDGRVSEAEFLAFFARCRDFQRSQAASAEAEAEAKDKEPELEEEELRRLLGDLDDHEGEAGPSSISQEAFVRFARHLMRVVKDTVLSAGLGVKEKVMRRLELREVVEVLEGPAKEDSGVLRVRARTMLDGATGWITLAGNQQSVYLEDGGGIFKVVKETILTDNFELAEAKDVTRKLHDTTRKLLPDELVEVYEWPRLEKSSGLTRMKCRAKSDGRIGWVTTVGNQGMVYLEVA